MSWLLAGTCEDAMTSHVALVTLLVGLLLVCCMIVARVAVMQLQPSVLLLWVLQLDHPLLLRIHVLSVNNSYVAFKASQRSGSRPR